MRYNMDRFKFVTGSLGIINIFSNITVIIIKL